jgi:hypothetical protein
MSLDWNSATKSGAFLLLFAVNILLKKKKICIFAASKTNISNIKYTNVGKAK